jgi:hypothetical protein
VVREEAARLAGDVRSMYQELAPGIRVALTTSVTWATQASCACAVASIVASLFLRM